MVFRTELACDHFVPIFPRLQVWKDFLESLWMVRPFLFLSVGFPLLELTFTLFTDRPSSVILDCTGQPGQFLNNGGVTPPPVDQHSEHASENSIVVVPPTPQPMPGTKKVITYFTNWPQYHTKFCSLPLRFSLATLTVHPHTARSMESRAVSQQRTSTRVTWM